MIILYMDYTYCINKNRKCLYITIIKSGRNRMTPQKKDVITLLSGILIEKSRWQIF